MAPDPLSPDALHASCPAEWLDFATTADLTPADLTLGQDRAVAAIHYAMDMPHEGYNLFVLGSTDLAEHRLVESLLTQYCPDEADGTFDWCYVHNFDVPHKPLYLKLPRGLGCQLKTDLEKLVERLLVTLPATFQSDEYQRQINDLREEYQEREEALFSKLDEQAQSLGLTLMRTPSGYTISPVKDDKLISASEFKELPEETQEHIKKNIDTVSAALKESVRTISEWQAESLERVKALNNSFVHEAIDPILSRLKAEYQQEPDVIRFLNRLHEHITDNVDDFLGQEDQGPQLPSKRAVQSRAFLPYQVNVLVDNREQTSTPILYEDNPTFANLVGRVEHIAEFGTLATNFTLIKPGSLHRANGGYLVIDAYKLLTNGFAWDALKRVISSREIRIESLEQALSLASTTTLEPEPIPTDLKVVLCGDRWLYYLLKQYDPDFSRLFKVQADLSETLHRTEDNVRQYANVIAALARRDALRPFDRDAVARLIEHSARSADDQGKLSLHAEQMADLMREAHYHARREERETVGVDAVNRALDTWRYRNSHYLELLQEQIDQGTLMIATDGAVPAQVNGLSVFQLGDFSFGRPSRITATARLGSGKVVDIERESELGGTLHSKGVMILSALLAHRYAPDFPLALAATLVFEQSYGPVDGDSASVAELLALLSAITGTPLKQNLAVTGSINQRGEVQAIGGVNEKVEGFFDVCQARGLTGEQGVAIPAANVRHLMLRRDVVDACREGRFTLYPLTTLDDAIALFTGETPGRPDADGRFPEGSFNHRVRARLKDFSKTLQAANRPTADTPENNAS